MAMYPVVCGANRYADIITDHLINRNILLAVIGHNEDQLRKMPMQRVVRSKSNICGPLEGQE